MKMPAFGWGAIGIVLMACNVLFLLSGMLLAALLMGDGHVALGLGVAVAWMVTLLSHCHD